MTSLQGLSVIVVGPSGGLGAPISRLLAQAGAELTLLGRDPARLQGVGVNGALVTGDLTDPGIGERVRDAALEAHGRVDGLVIASGVVAFGGVGELPDDALVQLFLVNTLAPIRIVRAVLPQLAESAQAGRAPFIAQISAVVAEQPTAGMAAYSASKAALTAYGAAASRELRRVGVRLIDARPPHTETGLANRPVSGQPPRLPEGLDPEAVAARIVAAIVNDERDLPSSAFA